MTARRFLASAATHCVAVLAILLLANPGAAAEVHGHAKLQSSLRHFRADDLGALLAGSNAEDLKLDLRLDTVWRRERWDMTVNTELVAFDGDSVAASSNPLDAELGGFLLGVPQPADDHEWLHLSHTFSSSGSRLVFGRLDRLSVGYTGDRFVARLGRQALSWGNGLVFQVLDLFNPFPPTVIDTDYKPGTDMLSTQWLFANGDDLQAIVVPRRPVRGRDVSADASSLAVKWHHFAGSTEIELMGAAHYDDTIAGIGASGNLAGGVWRVNVAHAALAGGGNTTSFLANLDHSWVWGGRNAYTFVEVFRNGYGVTNLDRDFTALSPALFSRLERGELFNLGRDELAAGLQIEWTPRLKVEPTVIVNLDDRSAMLVSRVTFDWLQNVTLDAGLQAPVGPRGTEYGGVPLRILGLYAGPGSLVWIRVARYF